MLPLRWLPRLVPQPISIGPHQSSSVSVDPAIITQHFPPFSMMAVLLALAHFFLLVEAVAQPLQLQTTYVSSSAIDSPECGQLPSTACATIQTGVGRTVDGGSVLVLPGTYSGLGNENIHLDGRSISIQSTDGPDVTIVDGRNKERLFTFAMGDGNNTSVRGLSIVNGYASLGGCMKIGDDASPLIENCLFKGCKSQAYASAENLTTASDEQKAGFGGAVFIGGEAAPTFRQCKFTSNYAIVGGGSLFIGDTSKPYFSNCHFEKESSGLYGGSVSTENQATARFDKCQWIENTSQYGGALDAGGPSKTIYTNSKFNNNTAETGAVMYHYSNSADEFYNCTFHSNIASGNGGVSVVSASSTPIYSDCRFAYNHAGGVGGVFHVEIRGSVLVENSRLRRNRALSGGGALSGRLTGRAMIKGCSIERNTAGSRAGALDLSDSVQVVSENTTFFLNFCESNSGAVQLKGNSSLTATDTQFLNNTAPNTGGALYVSGRSRLGLHNCLLAGNIAGNAGGALYFESTSPSVLNECRIENNAAGDHGGGIALQSLDTPDEDANLLIRSSSITKNLASNGGGIAIKSTLPLHIERSQITENVARFGGGLWIHSKGNLMDGLSRITGNRAESLDNNAVHQAVLKRARLNGSYQINIDGQIITRSEEDGDDAGYRPMPNNTDPTVSMGGGGGGGVFYDGSQDFLTCPGKCTIYDNEASYGQNQGGAPFRISVDPSSLRTSPKDSNQLTVSLLDPFDNLVTDTEEQYSVILSAHPLNSSLTVPIRLVGRYISKRIVYEGLALFGPFNIIGLLNGLYVLTVTANHLPSYDVSVEILSCGPGYQSIDDPLTMPYLCTLCLNSYALTEDSPCLPCPPGATCQGPNVTANPGFWMAPLSKTSIPEVWRCPPGQCIGNSECADHRSGILCSKCEEGYSDWRGSGTCEECSAQAPRWLLIPVFAALIVAGVLIRFPALCKSSISATLIFFVQYSSILLPASPQFEAVTDTVNLTFDWINKLSGTSCILRLDNFEKLLFGAFFPLMGITACVVWGIGLKLWYMLAQRWKDSHDVQTTAAGNSMVNHMPQKVVISWINAFLFTILWAYMLLSRVILQLLSCSSIAGESVVSEAPDQHCREGIHKTWWAIGWIMLCVWVLGLPVFLIGFLKWALFARARGGSSFWVQALEQIYADFKPRFWFFEFAFLVRKLMIVLLDVYTVFNPVCGGTCTSLSTL
ncbi:hypothetical protein DFJ77DRAFT_11314 [Powellomyces hirtus]|nr:hypothetical protein DFJ77DRAFT_11314 [Powellomyces hirtus]